MVEVKENAMARVAVRIDGAEHQFEPGTPISIGRAPSCTVVVKNSRVSRTHVTLGWEAARGWVLRDANSANGVFLGENQISEVSVGSGISVRLGDEDVSPLLEIYPATSRQTVNSSGGITIERRVAFSGGGTGTLAALEEIIVGKAAEADFMLGDVLVSRRHAKLIRTEAGWTLTDLGSTNGTFLNGQLVATSNVVDGDIITLGNTDLTIRNGNLDYLRSESEKTGGLYVSDLEFRVKSGQILLRGVNLRSAPGTLTAVIGPSGAGKSTLARVLSGVTSPTQGSVDFDGFNVHSSFELIRSRIGLVPQDDVLHISLQLEQALRYAAKLRLHADEDGRTRDEQVNRVIRQLELDKHREKRIDKLSGGQRKRASVALELLTEPALLILDEPTSGLDPALDRQVMRSLRELATADRAVLVITHSVACLDMCDEVLVLAPGGMPAYYGPPNRIRDFFGTDDWADIFERVAHDPEAAFDRYKDEGKVVPRAPEEQRRSTKDALVPKMPVFEQFRTLCARQMSLIWADRGYLTFLLLLPIVVGMLVLVVPGATGLGAADNDTPAEPSQLLAMLIIGASFMGASISIRDLVGERAIFLRERAVGLPVSAYLASKVLVFGVFAIFMAGVLSVVTFLVKPPPIQAILVPWPAFELFIALALTAVASMILGLLLSSIVRSSEQVMPLLIIVLMAQLVLNGGLLPLADRSFFYALSDLILAKWGLAMAASGVNLPGISPAIAEDPLWVHSIDNWLLSVVCMIAMAIAFATFTRLRLESKNLR
jgi:ABC-type multidrug transport system ATPase subunit/pSer/pThr/pTyr-binding forkhead associated (FHA) protein